MHHLLALLLTILPAVGSAALLHKVGVGAAVVYKLFAAHSIGLNLAVVPLVATLQQVNGDEEVYLVTVTNVDDTPATITFVNTYRQIPWVGVTVTSVAGILQTVTTLTTCVCTRIGAAAGTFQLLVKRITSTR